MDYLKYSYVWEINCVKCMCNVFRMCGTYKSNPSSRSFADFQCSHWSAKAHVAAYSNQFELLSPNANALTIVFGCTKRKKSKIGSFRHSNTITQMSVVHLFVLGNTIAPLNRTPNVPCLLLLHWRRCYSCLGATAGRFQRLPHLDLELCNNWLQLHFQLWLPAAARLQSVIWNGHMAAQALALAKFPLAPGLLLEKTAIAIALELELELKTSY